MTTRSHGTAPAAVLHLSALLDSPVRAPGEDPVGKLDDVIVRLGDDYPTVTGLVAGVGGRQVHVPMARVAELGEGRALLAKSKVDLRSFERRDGEVLLRADILGHRLIDVTDAALVRAWDLELRRTGGDWVLARVDTRRPARLFGLVRSGQGHPSRDWKSFEPLIGQIPATVARRRFGRLGRLKPAQLADLIEDASAEETGHILEAVHGDPELEADVFEELDPDTANRVFAGRSDAEVAQILARMRADDAADAVAELPQRRRQPVLDLLPLLARTEVMRLLGFSAASAGGLMGVELLTAPPETTAAGALRLAAEAVDLQAEARVTVHAVDPDGCLLGVVTLVALLGAEPTAALADLVDRDPACTEPDADLVDVALLMADYNLLTVPVIGPDRRLLGVITVDDLLEAVIPEDWRRREPPARPQTEPDLPAEEVRHD